MTGLDTNVIVRFLVQDEPAQSAAASRLFDTFTAAAPGFVSVISIVELVWVLQSCYGAGRDEIESAVEGLLRSRELIIERADLIWQSLRAFTKRERGLRRLRDRTLRPGRRLRSHNHL